MNDLQLIDDTVYGIEDNTVILRKKNPVVALVLAAAGSALTVWSLTSSSLVERADLSSMLMMAGGILALVGFIKLAMAMRASIPVYKPTGERIQRYELFYQAMDKPALCAAVTAGDVKRLTAIPRNEKSSNLLLTLYTTPSGSFSVGQVSQYVPHAFEPVTEVVRFPPEQGAIKITDH